MARPDKAAIEYDGAMSPLRFHSVISEAHTATAQVTKFPVQSGNEVSNHVIRKNRTISIEGVVSNHVIKGQTNEIDFGENNQRIVFAELKRLVNEGVVCEVTTNLGVYTPVIWIKFETKTTKDNPDALHFTIRGEEVILADSINKTVPTTLTEVVVTASRRPAAVAELAAAGVEVADSDTLFESALSIGESFAVDTFNAAGTAMQMVYEYTGLDTTTEFFNYDVHTTDINVLTALAEPIFNMQALVADDFGLSNISACLLEGGAELLEDELSEQIDTAAGKLTKSIYGAYYETFGVNGNESTGQILTSLGVDCLVLGAVGDGNSVTTDGLLAGIPSAADVLGGAIREGASKFKRVTSPSRLIKVVKNGG